MHAACCEGWSSLGLHQPHQRRHQAGTGSCQQQQQQLMTSDYERPPHQLAAQVLEKHWPEQLTASPSFSSAWSHCGGHIALAITGACILVFDTALQQHLALPYVGDSLAWSPSNSVLALVSNKTLRHATLPGREGDVASRQHSEQLTALQAQLGARSAHQVIWDTQRGTCLLVCQQSADPPRPGLAAQHAALHNGAGQNTVSNSSDTLL